MELQISPNAWSCLPTAFAMCLGISVKEVIEGIGHNGSEIIFDGYPEPMCRRGFHTSELIDYCLTEHSLFVSLIPLSVRLWTKDNKAYFDLYDNEVIDQRLEHYLTSPRAVILEPTHAVAYDGYEIYDPRGYKRSIVSMRIQHIMLF